MKRKIIIRNIILIIIAILLILGIAGWLINEKGKSYEIVKVEKYNYFIVKKDNLFGVIDGNGNIIIDAKYNEIRIPNPEKPVFICYSEANPIVLNEKNEEILHEFEKVEPIRLKDIASDLMYEKNVLTYCKDGKYGLVNFEGKVIAKPIYDKIEGLSYKEGELLVKQNDKYGVINTKGNKILNVEYDGISVDGYYNEQKGYSYAGYIVSKKTEEGYRYGYIDYKGKEVLKLEYNKLSRIIDIDDNQNIYLINAKNGQYGLIKNKKEIIKNEYQSMEYDENNKLIIVEKNKKYGVSDLEGKIIVPTKYKKIDIIGIYLYANDEDKTTVYNANGTEANIDKDIAILNTTNDKYRIKVNEKDGTKYGVIGKNGEQIIEEKYNYLEYLYENYFIVSNENSKLGIIDDKDNVIVEIENDSLQKLEDTQIVQAIMKETKTTRLYSNKMEKIAQMQDATIEMEKDYIKMYNKEETKYFDKEGKELKNTEIFTNNTLFSKCENGKWGFTDNAGTMVIEPKYDKVTEFNEYGFAAVKKDDKWGSIDAKGTEIVSPIYKFKDETEPSFIGTYYRMEYGFGETFYSDAK